MAPFVILVGSFLTLRALGLVWAPAEHLLDGWWSALRVALALMFTATAAAHFNRTRADLVRMVPPQLPRPEAWVSLTGVLEAAGAVGLLIPSLARPAAWGLSLMLLAMFPANVHAARAGVPLAGRPPTPLPLRTALQIVFLGATVAVGLGD